MKKILKIIIIFAFVFFAYSQKTEAVTFAVIGDTQDFVSGNSNGSLQTASRLVKKKRVRAVIAMGDLINNCTNESSCFLKFNDWKNAINPIYAKTYPVMGNHDRASEEADVAWQSTFSLPINGPDGYTETSYAFNKGDSHFIILNSSKPIINLINSNQRDWLEDDLELEKSRKKKNIFVFFHSPAYPVGFHIGSALDSYPAERDAFWEILDRYKIRAVFSGHEHFFARKKIDSSVYPNATSSIYQFIVGNTDSHAYSAPDGNLVEYYNPEKHFLIVKTYKKRIKTELYSIATGRKINAFSFRK